MVSNFSLINAIITVVVCAAVIAGAVWWIRSVFGKRNRKGPKQ
ncbi:MAG: hypothetical protein ACTH9T_05095 [Mycetocola reblochoni]|uniref:Uncharacterized protein n=1 Tax=Mycetocola reblochoni REB411 TaxID=1255698 RepID=A0A1R4IUU9_9MICO|nr:hypothetical protein [Mycetocola reblochoni]SJN23656.1 hypothetical protein FM119_03745 [Mycetocola reblochoni REB411]